MENQPQRPLPNATAVLVLGIIAIVGCFCDGIPGLVCGIIALVLAGKDLRDSRNCSQAERASQRISLSDRRT